MRKLCLIGALFWGSSLLGCTDPTALELVFGGDLVPGEDLDNLAIAMARRDAQIWSGSVELTAGDELPVTYRIAPTSRDDSIVELAVVASLGGGQLLSISRTASFIRGEVTSQRICLWRRCIGSSDPACAEGSCDEQGGDGDSDADGDSEADADGDGDPDADEDEEVEGDSSVDAHVDGDAEMDAGDGGSPGVLCTDTCPMAFDAWCEDNGAGTTSGWCDFGTDCTDCGPRNPADCRPYCQFRECGTDGCGGTCPPGCADGEECLHPGQCVRWVEIRPTEPFWMGSPVGEVGRDADEVLHEVYLNRPFVMASTEMTRRMHAALLEHPPPGYIEEGAEEVPTFGVTFHNAAWVANMFSRLSGLRPCYDCALSGDLICSPSARYRTPYDCPGYRLPTEAEWEFAARGGETTATYAGDLDEGLGLECETPHPMLDPIAWHCGNSDTRQTTGLLEPNAFGLYDMLGNVLEWVHDWYGPYPEVPTANPTGPPTGVLRSVRGGSYSSEASMQRAANRLGIDPDTQYSNVGARLVRTVE